MENKYIKIFTIKRKKFLNLEIVLNHKIWALKTFIWTSKQVQYKTF